MALAATTALIALFLAVAAPAPARAAIPTDEDCLACHGDDETLSMRRGGKTVSLYVKPAILKASAHAKVACAECHVAFDPEQEPHKPNITPVDCAACHKNAASKHPIHAAVIASGGKAGSRGISCKGCHGTHDVGRAAAGPDSSVALAEQDAACARCHAE